MSADSGNQQIDFVACDSCKAKPGSPILCKGCLDNRASIGVLSQARDKFKKERDELGHEMLELIAVTEKRIAEVQSENESIQRSRDCWEETARQHCKNEQFYRDIVVKIGMLFGDAAKTSDDGTIQEDVLALNVYPLVEELVAKSLTIHYYFRNELKWK